MGEKPCIREPLAPSPREAGLSRRQELAEAPTARVTFKAQTAPACPTGGEGGCPGRCHELARLMEEQNKLLCDLLAAVNALTALQLTRVQE